MHEVGRASADGAPRIGEGEICAAPTERTQAVSKIGSNGPEGEITRGSAGRNGFRPASQERESASDDQSEDYKPKECSRGTGSSFIRVNDALMRFAHPRAPDTEKTPKE